MKSLSIIAILALAVSCTSTEDQKQVKKTSNHWLTEAESDGERFKRLETYLRGFDQPMWEVGHRYEKVYEAIDNKNYELASYHWKKIKKTIINGYLKRPARQKSADSMFLNNGVWQSLDSALSSKSDKKIKAAFHIARQSCMACHLAEKVPYMNNQKIFHDTEAFSKK